MKVSVSRKMEIGQATGSNDSTAKRTNVTKSQKMLSDDQVVTEQGGELNSANSTEASGDNIKTSGRLDCASGPGITNDDASVAHDVEFKKSISGASPNVSQSAVEAFCNMLKSKVRYCDLLESFVTFKTQHQEFVQQVLVTHGCFFEFLVDFAKDLAPQGFSSKLRSKLLTTLKRHVCEALFVSDLRSKKLEEMFETNVKSGLADRAFFMETLRVHSARFLVADGWITYVPLPDAMKACSEQYEKLRVACSFPHLHHLVSAKPHFKRIFSEYARLPSNVQRYIVEKESSFFDVLDVIAGQHNAENYFETRAHFNSALFGELLRYLHTRKRLTLTEAVDLISQGSEGLVGRGNVESCLLDPGAGKTSVEFDRSSDAVVICCSFDESQPVLPNQVRNTRFAFRTLPAPLYPPSLPPPAKNTHRKSTKVEIDAVADSIGDVLNLQVSPEVRFTRLLELIKSLPKALGLEILWTHDSFWNFVVARALNWEVLRKTIVHVVRERLGASTALSSEIVRALCGENTKLITARELTKVLADSDTLTVVNCSQLGDLVFVKRTGTDRRPIFVSADEKDVVATVLSFFETGGAVLFERLFSSAWSSRDFTETGRRILFGRFESESSLPLTTHRVHFRRFFLMFPTIFRVLDDGSVMVYDQKQKKIAAAFRTAIPSDEKRNSRADEQRGCCNVENVKSDLCVLPVVERCTEMGSCADEYKLSRDQRKACAYKGELNGNQVVKQRAASDTGGCRNSNDCVERESSGELAGISENLIKHVSMGRLLGCDSREMDIDDLVESLIDAVFSGKSLKNLKDNRMMLRVFRSKVIDVLKRVDKMQLFEPDQTGFCRKVRLVLTPPGSVDPPADTPLAVFRRISHVTRVSNSKMKKYISSVASLNNKPLSLNILFTLVCQKFAEKKVFPKTSDDLLHCQVVYCLKFDPNFALNPAEQTFCLSAACKTPPPSLESVMQDVHNDEVLEFTAKCFESSSGTRCLGVREIIDKVFSNFRKRLGATPKSVVTLVIQYLLVHSPRLGFTLDGKMALLPNGGENDDFSSSSDEGSLESKRSLDSVTPSCQPSKKETLITTPSLEVEVVRKTNMSRDREREDQHTASNYVVARGFETVEAFRKSASQSWPESEDPFVRDAYSERPTPVSSLTVSPTHVIVDARSALTPSLFSSPNIHYDRSKRSNGERLPATAAENPRKLHDVAARGRLHLPQATHSSTTDGTASVGARGLLESAQPQGGFVEVKQREPTPATKGAEEVVSVGDVRIPSHGADVVYRKRKLDDDPAQDTENRISFPRRPEPANPTDGTRRELHDALTTCLSDLNFFAPTQKVLDAVRARLCDERLVRSRVALEGRALEHLALSGDQFAFGSYYGGPGASWVLYRPQMAGRAKVCAPSLPHIELLSEVVEWCETQLANRPEYRENLSSLSALAAGQFRPKMSITSDVEVAAICRWLILIGCVRHPERFAFPNEQRAIHLRKSVTCKLKPKVASSTRVAGEAGLAPPEKRPNPPDTKTPRMQPTSSPSASPTSQSKAVRVLDLIADVIRSRGPLTKTKLRDIWSAEASKDLVKVLGTGVSFAFAFRKFEKCFPTSADGSLTVNESMLNRFKKKLV